MLRKCKNPFLADYKLDDWHRCMLGRLLVLLRENRVLSTTTEIVKVKLF